jgi:release factor glutamine methyltransferase
VTRSIAAVVNDAAGRLAGAGFTAAESRTDAGVLARAILGWTTAQWLAHVQDIAPPGFATELNAAIARRARHEPVAYITGQREFYGRDFRVTPDVLIPRPETELLVDAALKLFRQPSAVSRQPARIIDIGTGSGCIAVTLAAERPNAIIVATDISAAAIAVARGNAARHQVDGRITFVEGSLFAGLTGGWDLVVSNPPYVSENDRETLAPDVREFEPGLALFGGDDGLDVIRELVPAAAQALNPGGSLLMEIGAGQADEVKKIVEQAGLVDIRFLADLQDIPRVAIAIQPADRRT